jgi:hypothetical protein
MIKHFDPLVNMIADLVTIQTDGTAAARAGAISPATVELLADASDALVKAAESLKSDIEKHIAYPLVPPVSSQEAFLASVARVTIRKKLTSKAAGAA